MTDMQRVVIVGGGTMGCGVGVVFACGGWRVDVVSPSAATRATFPARFAQAMTKLGRTLDTALLAVHADLASVPWQDVALVVENAVEDLAVKRRVFADLVEHSRPDTPLTSNSSSLPISEIGEGLPTQERMLGLHFYMPAYLVPLVEVVCGERSDVAVAQRVGEWMWALGKRPVQVKRDIAGFLANRIQHALIRESVNMLEMGIASPEDIDAAVRYSFGFRLAAAGPLMQREHAGWDMSHSVAKSLYPHLPTMTGPPPVVDALVAKGHFGMKSGHGLYPWDAASIAWEKERYEKAQKAVLEVFAREGLQ
jgi:3-hydroxybutyryl-CoA dehydrogenase